jgi:hypothetical protein
MLERRIQGRLIELAVVVDPPRSTGLNIRERSSRDLSLRVCRCQRRSSRRKSRVASALAAGLKLTQHFPQRFFDRRARNV